MEGSLRLADPYMPFSFPWLFPFDFLSNAALIASKVPDQALGNLTSIPNYWSAKIKRFGQTSSSTPQQKIETWHDPD